MTVYEGLDAFTPPGRPVVLSIGNFDGLHAGHQQLLDRLGRAAHKRNGMSLALTFKPHPLELLRPEAAPPVLTGLGRKLELMAAFGVDACLVYRTDADLLAMPPKAFFESVIRGSLGAVGLVEGPDFHFGRGRQGNIETLSAWARQAGMFLDVVGALDMAGGPVSSSRIRDLLIEGRVTDATQLLTRPHRIDGQVVVGEKRGRTLGYPTANLADIQEIVPAAGIYAASAHWDDQVWPGALHLGPRPTFRSERPMVEVYLIDFDGDLYGRRLAVDFHARLRDIRRFDGPESLCKQMARDVEQARAILAEQGIAAR